MLVGGVSVNSFCQQGGLFSLSVKRHSILLLLLLLLLLLYNYILYNSFFRIKNLFSKGALNVTIIIIIILNINVYLSANQIFRMISEGSCDWSNDAKISVLKLQE